MTFEKNNISIFSIVLIDYFDKYIYCFRTLLNQLYEVFKILKNLKKGLKITFRLIGLLLRGVLVLITFGNYLSYHLGKLKERRDKFCNFTTNAKRQIEIERKPTRMKL